MTKRNRPATFPYTASQNYKDSPTIREVGRFQIDLVNLRPEDGEGEWGFVNVGMLTPSTYDYIEGKEGTTPFAWMSLNQSEAEELAIALLYGLTNGTFEKPEASFAEKLALMGDAIEATNHSLKELAQKLKAAGYPVVTDYDEED